jgi:hypothetical protein
MFARETFAVQGPNHLLAKDFKHDCLPLSQRQGRFELTERDGGVGASVIVIILLNPHPAGTKHDAANVVLGVGGADAEPTGLAAVQGHVVQADLAGNHNVLEIKTDRGRRRVLVLGVFGSAKGSVHEVPVAATLLDVKPPALKAARKPRHAPFRRRERGREIFGNEQLAGPRHERGRFTIRIVRGRLSARRSARKEDQD